MKKTLLTILCAFFGLCSMAQSEKNFTETYVVTVNGNVQDPQSVDVVISENGDNTINLVLKSFVLHTDEIENLPLGDITLSNIPSEEGQDGLTHFADKGRTFTIPTENLPSQVQMMIALGMLDLDLSDIPYELEGKYNDTKLYCTIDIDMSRMEQQIFVEVGTDNFNSPTPVGKVYSEQLVVTVNGISTEPQMTDVTVYDNGDGTINFELKNFFLGAGEESMPVGNIFIENLSVVEGEDGLSHFSYNGPLTILAGDMEGVSEEDWVGPMLGEIPLALVGKMNDEKLFVTIDISLEILSQVVHVELGTDDFNAPTPVGKVYSEQLVVTVNGISTEPQMTDVTVYDNGDGTINFELKNFFLGAGEESMPVGNIFIENLSVVEGEDGLSHFSYNGPLTILAGDMEGVSEEDWVGPMLGEIPLALVGKMNDEKLFVTIDISLEILSQVVHVELGTDDFNTPAPVGKIYSEQLVVTVNGISTEPQMTDVTVYDNGDGTINFELKNFFLGAGEESMPVGNIFIENLSVVEGEDGLSHFSYNGPLTILAGDMEGVSEEDWVGPMLGEIPLALVGKMNDEKLFVTIDISLEILSQVVHVELGTDDFSAEILGDINGDNKVDVADAQSVLNIIADEDYAQVADVNGDNKVDVADYQSVLNIMAEQ